MAADTLTPDSHADSTARRGCVATALAGGGSGAAPAGVPAKSLAGAGSLLSDFAAALDPCEMMVKAGMEPDSWQRQVLEFEGQKLLLNIARQCGKSTVCAAKGLHRALYEPGALVLLASPSLRQSTELMRKVREFLAALPEVVPLRDESSLRLEFENKSRIVALPGNATTTRGFSAASLIICDEASRVDDELFRSLRPILATSGGQFFALSTPAGLRGWWSDSWHSATQDWRRIRITAEECGRIDSVWLEDERNLVGEFTFRQEYLCDFVDAENQIFPTELIEAAISSEVKNLWPV